MSITRSSRLQEYSVALLCTAVASGMVLALQRVGYTGLSPLLGAVVISAWYGGLGPGTLSLILSSVIAYRLLPRNGARADQVDLIRTSVFSVVSLIASALHFVTRRARELAEKARDAAERSRIAAEEASAAKTRFLAMVSHELRTPLSPVLMAVALAEADPIVAERVKDELDTIRRNVALQVRLIDDLLDVVKFANGKLPLTLKHLDLHIPLAAAVRTCREGFDEKRLEVRTDFAATETGVYADSDRMQQVFWNLLRNAIKFTPEGGWIAVRTRDEPDGWIAVEIADSGKGIEQNQLATVFMAFEQGGEDVTRRFGGLGLGLSICRALTDAHGGTVTAASEGVGKGATFTVRIPLKPAAVQLDQSQKPDNSISHA